MKKPAKAVLKNMVLLLALIDYEGEGAGLHHFKIKSGTATGANFCTGDLEVLSISKAYRDTVEVFERVDVMKERIRQESYASRKIAEGISLVQALNGITGDLEASGTREGHMRAVKVITEVYEMEGAR